MADKVPLPWHVNPTVGKDLKIHQDADLYCTRLELAFIRDVRQSADYLKGFVEDLMLLSGDCPELTSVLRETEKDPLWAALKPTQTQIANENKNRNQAIDLLQELRNDESHEGTSSRPKPHEARTAWHYLITTIMISTGKVTTSALGSQIETPSGRDPRRFETLLR